MSGPEELERNCRRLLAWYPAWHRQIHGEEMIGVLLAAAPEGKRRPTLAETLNIIWAALLIRLRPRSAAKPDEGWRDALAVFSVVAPVALTCMTITGVVLTGPEIGEVYPIAAVPYAIFYGLGLVLPLVLRRRHRTAGYVSLLATALLVLGSVDALSGDLGRQVFAYPLFAYAAETVALLGSPGPRRGLQFLSRRTWAMIVAAGVAAGVFWYASTTVGELLVEPLRSELPQLHAALITGALAVAALAVIVACVAVRSLLGRRVLLILAVLSYVLLANLVVYTSADNYSAFVALITYLPPLAAGAVFLGMAIRSRRRGPGNGQLA